MNRKTIRLLLKNEGETAISVFLNFLAWMGGIEMFALRGAGTMR